MKTAMQEFIDWLVIYDENQPYLNPREVIFKAKDLLIKEKQQIVDAYHINPLETKWGYLGEQYYNETFKQ